MRPIVITGARAPAALDLARAFRAAGHPVCLADSMTPLSARLSRHGYDLIRLPAPNHAPNAFAEAVTALARSTDAPLIVPTCEEVFHLSRVADAQGWSAQLFAPPPAVLSRLHSKASFIVHARALGLDVPQTIRITTPAQLTDLPAWPDGMVLKPEFSRFGATTRIRPDAGALSSLNPSPARPWVAQQFVSGDEICLWAAARHGEIVASAAYRPVWRQGGSAAFAFQRIDCPSALAIARAIVAADSITGQVSFDIILTPDGRAFPIECNPRATSGLHLFRGDPALAHAMLGAGSAIAAPDGLFYLSPAMATLGLAAALRSGRLAPFLADWRSGQDALTRPGDRLPALGALIDTVRFTLAGLSRGQGTVAAMTDDIEWNGDGA